MDYCLVLTERAEGAGPSCCRYRSASYSDEDFESEVKDLAQLALNEMPASEF